MSKTCEVHRTHRPRPLGLVEHHVWPLGMQGPDDPTNRVTVCDTGHRNLHRLMADLLHGGPMRKAGTRRERALAQRGYDAWVAAGRPGRPVFQLGES